MDFERTLNVFDKRWLVSISSSRSVPHRRLWNASRAHISCTALVIHIPGPAPVTTIVPAVVTVPFVDTLTVQRR